MQTIKVTSPVTYENPLGFVTINLVDFEKSKHEPFDDEARDAVEVAIASGAIVPSVAELKTAHERLQERERELDAERARLAGERRANEAEAQRLADEKAAAEKLARDTTAAEAAAKAAAEKVAKPVKPAGDDKK